MQLLVKNKKYIFGVLKELMEKSPFASMQMLTFAHPPQHQPALTDFLLSDLPNDDLSKRKSKNMQENLQNFKQLLQEELEDEKHCGKIAIFDVGRAKNKKYDYKAFVQVGHVPCLLTQNSTLFLLSLGEGTARPRLHRLLHPLERFFLQGMPGEAAKGLSATAALGSAGNAFTAPVAGRALHSLLRVILGIPPEADENIYQLTLPRCDTELDQVDSGPETPRSETKSLIQKAH